MAQGKETAKEMTQWIKDEQKIHETTSFGQNARAVSDALHEQQRRVKVVENAESRVTAVKDDDVSTKYGTLKRVANHRATCLRDVNDIASLESSFNVSAIAIKTSTKDEFERRPLTRTHPTQLQATVT